MDEGVNLTETSETSETSETGAETETVSSRSRPPLPFAAVALVLVLLAACGPSPRPVTPSLESSWPTALGNARRAPFENELIRDTLEVVWDIDAGTGMRSSVLLTDSAVFAGATNRVLFAFSARNGRRDWYQRFEGELASEIVRSGRTLFFTTTESNGRVHARDMERGRKRWNSNIGPSRFSPVLDQGLLYVGTDRGVVHAFRTENGADLWRARLSGAVAATPLSHRDALIVITSTDTIYRIAKHNGAILARRAIRSTVSTAPALAGDTVVLGTHSGAVMGVDANTLEPRWRVETGDAILAAPIVSSDGTIHVLNRAATIWRINHGRGSEVVKLPGAATSSFTLARDRYIVGLVDGSLYTTDMSGRIIVRHKFNDSVSAPVVVNAGALYVPLLRGRIVKMR